jgi:hypothetical protein
LIGLILFRFNTGDRYTCVLNLGFIIAATKFEINFIFGDPSGFVASPGYRNWPILFACFNNPFG